MLGIFNLTERLAKECMVLVTSKVLSVSDELPIQGAWAGSRDCRTYHASLYDAFELFPNTVYCLKSFPNG